MSASPRVCVRWASNCCFLRSHFISFLPKNQKEIAEGARNGGFPFSFSSSSWFFRVHREEPEFEIGCLVAVCLLPVLHEWRGGGGGDWCDASTGCCQGQAADAAYWPERSFKRNGPKALYLGFAPALTRSVLYGGLRLGLYEPCKHVCDYMFGSTNILVKIASGAFSGAIATSLTNPVEVLKVRLQMNSNSKIGPIKEVHKIVREERIKALWKGVGPATARASALTASQLATYDESKQALLKWTPIQEGQAA